MGTLGFLGLVLGEEANLPGLCEDVKSMKRNRINRSFNSSFWYFLLMAFLGCSFNVSPFSGTSF